MTEPAGHWTTRGAPASVDWCEPNYLHSSFVAEWWNTLSCLPMVVLGLYGAWFAYRSRVELRFIFGFFTVSMVGLGSIGFHGTLLKVAQAMDELPMIYGGLTLAYCLANRSHSDPARARRWLLGLGGYAVAFTAAYFSLEDYFSFFVVSYGVIMVLLVIAGSWVAWGPTGSSNHRRLVGTAAGLFLLAFTTFWLPEHVFFPCDHPVQQLELHSLWHLTAGMGAYMGFLCVLWDRLSQLGLEPKIGSPWWLRLPSFRESAEQ